MSRVAAAAVALALLLDLTVAEPPERIHPVAAFGRLVAPLDRPWRRPRAVGAIAALVLPLGAGAIAGGIATLAAAFHPIAGAIVAGIVLFSATSLRMLLSVAGEVIDLAGSDLDRARTEVRSLVGREATALSPGEIRSAAVESAAENLADGLVAPLLAFALCAPISLGLAAGATTWVKAVNTMDSMLGYESKSVGWASARLDDFAMWVPARIAAGAIAIAGRNPSAISRARSWAGEPKSPNSGWPMATLAAALEAQLHKPGAYALNPGAGLPTTAQAHRGIRIVGAAGLLAFVSGGVIAWS
jgi:adenosylcobinamide-phosphate synthase